MAALDWHEVGARYRGLVERVNTVAELMELIGEMQGELGVSHAYTWGYNRGEGISYTLGQLGATFSFCLHANAWIVTQLDTGEPGNPEAFCPLQAPGLGITPGTRLWAIDGVPLEKNRSPAQGLIHKAETYVSLLISGPEDGDKRTVWVKTLADGTAMRYRDWVERNRHTVHAATQGRVGYIHIPDMAEEGFGEFFRSYMGEFDRDGLVVDVRANSGGYISTLLLSVLARKRLGYDQTRWEGRVPYLTESPAGPMVALCNEMTGSDD
jgi:tricorn protease